MSRRRSAKGVRPFVALDLDCAHCGSWLDRVSIHTDREAPGELQWGKDGGPWRVGAMLRLQGRPAGSLQELMRLAVADPGLPRVAVFDCNRCGANPQRGVDAIRSDLLGMWSPGRMGTRRLPVG